MLYCAFLMMNSFTCLRGHANAAYQNDTYVSLGVVDNHILDLTARVVI